MTAMTATDEAIFGDLRPISSSLFIVPEPSRNRQARDEWRSGPESKVESLIPAVDEKAQTIYSAVQLVATYYHHEVIYVVGAYSFGTPAEESDLDVLIIKQTGAPKNKRLRRL